ncbi:hypothetical protein PRIPAC_84229 [Pristionchus pacificus]|uniref:Uncharacterized protein n=1 Tax=Pristionchus pacificus TaxID=54126 RepID=A0A2A6BV48_PRIPA|nr:hypothetical protein PRIPAC_84229 [Pristionchus pacificus]|eukprot:PDM69765.1 hypothetical protein PRIPAC_44861 [Pristionchus pacificus]
MRDSLSADDSLSFMSEFGNDVDEDAVIEIGRASQYQPRSDFEDSDKKYRCLCNIVHSETGVKIIAGMLCLTALVELWAFSLNLLAWSDGKTDTHVQSSFIQFLFGCFVAGSVILALIKKRSGYLVPYMAMQIVGLACACIFFVAFIYIALFEFEPETASVFFPKQQWNPTAITKPNYANYASFVMLFITGALIAIQIWLIDIVFTCWRYFRDKRTSVLREQRQNYLNCKQLPPVRGTTQPYPLRVCISVDAIPTPRAHAARLTSNSADRIDKGEPPRSRLETVASKYSKRFVLLDLPPLHHSQSTYTLPISRVQPSRVYSTSLGALNLRTTA